jgi:hypothetical protein
MNNNITFGIDGPMMSGKWYNPKTGDTFTVRETFFEDNELIIQAMDGRLFKFDRIQDYIQSNGNEEFKQPEPQPKQSNNDIPSEILDMIEDTSYIDDLITPMPYSQPQSFISQQPMSNPLDRPVKSTNTTIIERALNNKKEPKIHCDIKWKDMPLNEINTLIDMLGIEKEEIVEWYVNKLDINSIMEGVKNDLKAYIEKSLPSQPEPEPIETQEIIKPKPSKKTKSAK